MAKLFCLTGTVAIMLLTSCSTSNSPQTDLEKPSASVQGTGSPSEPDESGDQVTTTDPLSVPRFDIREKSQLYPYRSDSPYASVVRDCALIEDYNVACTLPA